jgi:CspA family cold shock protein
MMQGTIKRIVADKGYAFIRDAEGREYFCHRSAVVGRQFEVLQEGDTVTFEEVPSAKGLRAENVMRA